MRPGTTGDGSHSFGSLTRRNLLGGAAATAALFGLVPAALAQSWRKPNIIFIMADDLGYADVSCYGRREYQTPNIDRLASEGVKLTDAYANSPVCSATRVSLMTGLYQYRLRVGLEEPLMPKSAYGLPSSQTTLPSMLRNAGYGTSLIGKWHLGELPDYGPLQSGYDHFWGIRGGGVDYFTHDVAGIADLWDGTEPVEKTGYLTELIGQQAVDFIEKSDTDTKPFFLSLHFTAPHWPWEGPADGKESARIGAGKSFKTILHFDGGDMDTYAAMVVSMDQQIGELLEALENKGIAEDTLIVFTSDNGGERFSDVWPFVGRKGELLEGGLRIPAIVRWPGHVAAGQVSKQVCATMDWVPTILQAAGVEIPELDGKSILPAIISANAEIERTLYWRFLNMDQEACRSGDWKYLKILQNTFLFNIARDPLERADLKDRFPEKYEELKSGFDAWNQTMLPLDPKAATRGFMGNELADHFGIDTPVTRTAPMSDGAATISPR